jgi:hypothetical protein
MVLYETTGVIMYKTVIIPSSFKGPQGDLDLSICGVLQKVYNLTELYLVTTSVYSQDETIFGNLKERSIHLEHSQHSEIQRGIIISFRKL